MSATLHTRTRSPWNGQLVDPEATFQPIRQSLNRYYKSRTDATRTRKARRTARALREARALKAA